MSEDLEGSASGIEFGGEQGQTENAETVGSTDMVHSATAGTMASGTSQVATDGNFEDDEEEPKLRYQRLGGSLTDLLKDDTASCLAAHSRFLAMGTDGGNVHILDFNGNEIKRFPAHSKVVNAVCIDESGEYVVSCSNDGKVVVSSVYEDERLVVPHACAVYAVALDPGFRPKEKRFVQGGVDGKLMISEKGWFSASRTKALYTGEGPIFTLAWRGNYIAFANDKGVMVWDVTLGRRITYVTRPADAPPADAYRCHIAWKDDTTFLIGWADSVKVAVVKPRTPGDMKTTLPVYVEVIASFRTDYWICGIAPHDNDLAILAFVPPDLDQSNVAPGENTVSLAPELCVVTYNNTELSSDALSVIGFEQYQANNYTMAHLHGENTYYVVSPRDIVMAKPRTADDHVSWLLSKGRYEDAYQAAIEGDRIKELKQFTVDDVGQRYIQALCDSEHYAEAAAACDRVLPNDPQIWDEWVHVFAEHGQLPSLGPFLNKDGRRLDSATYDFVLASFIRASHKALLTAVKTWPPEIYDLHHAIDESKAALHVLPADESAMLLEALAEMYFLNGQYSDTLHIYLDLGRGDPIGLIENHRLYEQALNDLVLLFDFDSGAGMVVSYFIHFGWSTLLSMAGLGQKTGQGVQQTDVHTCSQKAVNLLLDHIEELPPQAVAAQLKKHREYLHMYLSALFKRDPHAGAMLHDMHVSLYADYDYPQLLPFLRKSNYYNLDKALKECQQRDLIPETVFLLGRIGNTKEALTLIIERLGDVDQAIEFAKEQNDHELWKALIDWAIDKPELIIGLLNEIGTHVDPLVLIKRIPPGLDIRGLRNALVKIMQDYNLQVSLREGCEKILVADVVTLTEQCVRGRRRALPLGGSEPCELCTGPLRNDAGREVGIIAFFCRHAYHEACLKSKHGAAFDDHDLGPLAVGSQDHRRPSRPHIGVYCPLCQSMERHKRVVVGA